MGGRAISAAGSSLFQRSMRQKEPSPMVQKSGLRNAARSFCFYRGFQIPISSLTSLKHLTAKSRSSLVWPAETWVRILSLPLGTTG